MTTRLLMMGLAGWRRRLHTNSLTFAMIIVAAAALMVSIQLRDVADEPWEKTFEATNGAHLLAFGRSADVGRLADVDGVTEVAPPTPMVVTSLTSGDGSTYALRAIGADAAPLVERPVLTNGRWRQVDGEVVLERSYANTLGISTGDSIRLQRVDGSAAFTVVGIAVLASEAPYPDSQPGVGFVGLDDVAAIQPDATTWGWMQAVRIEDAALVSSAARQAFAVLPAETFLRTYDHRVEDATARHRTTAIVLRALAVMLLVAVGLVLATLVGARVLDRSEEMALLKAVGFTPLQVSLVVAAELLATATTAAAIGALAGAWLTPRILLDSTELLGTVPVAISPGRMALTVAIVVLVVAVAAVIPMRRAARSGVLEALRAGLGRGSSGRVPRRVPLRRPLPLALALKQLLARPARSVATAAALALTVGSLVAGLAFEATVQNEDRAERAELADRAVGAGPEGPAGQRAEPIGGALAPRTPDPVAIVDATREQLRPIVHGFNAVLVVVAVINLLATALLSIRQRRRDIAITRAVGFTPKQVRRAVFCADGLLGLVAALAGLPLGAALFFGVYQIVNGNTDLAVLPPLSQLAGVPVVCVAAVIAVIAIPAHAAARLPVTTGLHRG